MYHIFCCFYSDPYSPLCFHSISSLASCKIAQKQDFIGCDSSKSHVKRMVPRKKQLLSIFKRTDIPVWYKGNIFFNQKQEPVLNQN